MTVPFILFPGLSTFEFFLFHGLQAVLNILFLSIFLSAYFRYRPDEKGTLDPRYHLATSGLIELGNIATGISWYILVLFAIGGIIFQFILFLAIPIILLNLRYYGQANLKAKDFLVLCGLFLGALCLSTWLTSSILNLAGVSNYFLFRL